MSDAADFEFKDRDEKKKKKRQKKSAAPNLVSLYAHHDLIIRPDLDLWEVCINKDDKLSTLQRIKGRRLVAWQQGWQQWNLVSDGDILLHVMM